MTDVVVLDIGMGNLRSVTRAIERADGRPLVTEDPAKVAGASRLIVPGQGQFRDCARELSDGLGDAVRAFIATGRPYLGICLGMQALFASSEEAPGERGLAILNGAVKRFPHEMRSSAGERLKIPHMGWNRIESNGHPLLEGQSWFYFVHSYYVAPENVAEVVAESEHGIRFCAAVARDNVFACQFHPEKSGAAGHALLTRFLK